MRVLNARALVLLSCALAASIAGCAAPTGPAALEQAGAAVERARGIPRVRALAAAELDRAEVALEHARTAARAGAPPDQVEHMAYIVQRRAAFAEARAAERVARLELTKLQRALDRVAAHEPRQQDQRWPTWVRADRPARIPPEPDQRAAAPAPDDRQANRPLEEDQRERTWVRENGQASHPTEEDRAAVLLPTDPQARVPLEHDRRARARVQENRPPGTPSEQEGGEAAPGQNEWQAGAPPEQNGREQPSLTDLQTHASLERNRGQAAAAQEHRLEHAGLAEERLDHALMQTERLAPSPAEQDPRGAASVETGPQVRTPPEQAEPAPARGRGREAGQMGAPPEEMRAPLEESPRDRALMETERLAPSPAEQDRRGAGSVPAERLARTQPEQGEQARARVREAGQIGAPVVKMPAPLEETPRDRALMQTERLARSPAEQERRDRALMQTERLALAEHERWEARSAAGDRQAHTAEPGAIVAMVDAMPPDLTIRLAGLAFDGVEPTNHTLEELAAMAERLLREPGRSLVIEAVFDLPDPEARTVTERRVEVVRAILLRHGIQSARVVVRAANGSVEPLPAPAFAGSPD